jgi:hypothetical protein
MKKIIDNALNSSLLSAIQEPINSGDMPWFFIENSAANPKKDVDKELIKETPLNYSFCHAVFNKDVSNNAISALYDLTNSISLILKDLFELEKTYKVFRLRWGMTTTLNKIHKHTPHIDMPTPHKNILFYLNDCDGDTYFYDKEHKIVDSVTPKENRAVLFDGGTLHC